MMPQFQLACPGSVSEVLHILSGVEGETSFLSGGTDLILQINEGRKHPDWVIDLSQIPELCYIRSEGERIRIGGATTFAEIARSPLLRDKTRCLAKAAEQVGSVQIRNRATLGGNIASASPAGDSLPALLALDAWLTILGPAGKRRVAFERLQTEPGQELRRGEFIIGIDFPLDGTVRNQEIRTADLGKRTAAFRVSAFGKIGSRRSVTIARLNMAALLEIDSGKGVIRKAGVALGALGNRPFRPREIEEEICGRRIDEPMIDFVSGCLQETVDQAIPGRYSQEYKRQAIRGLAADVFGDLARQVREKEGKEFGN